MEPVSAAVGALSLIEGCLKVGRDLSHKYRDYKNAERDIAETLLQVRVIWERSETQIEFLHGIWSVLEPRQQETNHHLLMVLHSKLENVVYLLDQAIGGEVEKYNIPSLNRVIIKRGTTKDGMFALKIKERLDYAVTDFEKWHNLSFNPQWYLIARNKDEAIDKYILNHKERAQDPLRRLRHLRKSITEMAQKNKLASHENIKSEDPLEDRRPIENSSAAIAQFRDNTDDAVVDLILVPPYADRAATIQGLQVLTRALHRMDHDTFGLLRCSSIINKSGTEGGTEQLSFELVFLIPPGMTGPRSLRDLLRSHNPTLNLKFAICRQLATSVFYMHASGLVHKNIRPETILLFDQEGSPIKASFLVGFEKFRMASGATNMAGDDLVERNLYRHPSRQGNDPEMEYNMQHDVYSLGVCMLEIGLWTSFVVQSNAEGKFEGKEFMPDPILAISDQLTPFNVRNRSSSIKKRFTILARDKLPGLMGTKFTEVVVKCLTCLDEAGSLNKSSNDDPQGIDVGVQYIEDVLSELQIISV